MTDVTLAELAASHPHHLVIGAAQALLDGRIGAFLAVPDDVSPELGESTLAALVAVLQAGRAVLVMTTSPEDARRVRDQLGAVQTFGWGCA